MGPINHKLVEVESLHEHLKAAAREVGKHFTRPDDDWQMMLHIVSKEGRVNVAPLSSGFFGSQIAKEALVRGVFPKMVNEFDVVSFGLVLSTWVLVMDKPDGYKPGDDLPKPSDHPDREERLAISSVCEDRMLMSWATILRHDNRPPTLAKWEDLPLDDPESRVEGIFGNLTNVFKEARSA